MANAPVIFFAYSRYDKALRSLQSLKANAMASSSELYIFADGPKEDAATLMLENIKRTREVLHSEKWCGSVTIQESPVNKGLAASVISGVTEITKKYGKAIIIEDDALLSPFFLNFMNDALNEYQNEERVFGVGGWTYFPRQGTLQEPFFLRYPDSLAWAVYERSWKHFIHNAAVAKKQMAEKKQTRQFNPFRSLHFFDAMLDDQISKKIDSWAIRWTATAVIHNALFLYPHISMARNMGNTEGTHEMVKDYNADLEIADKPVRVVKKNIEENKIAFNEWKRFARIHFLNTPVSVRIKRTIKSSIPLPLKKMLKKTFTKKGLSVKNLLSSQPVSRKFGFDRGMPIDRYYIEKFLEANRKSLKGKVLEVESSLYSRKFDNGITSFEVLSYKNENGITSGDLTNPVTLPENEMDCFICTQTLNFIYDVKAAMAGCYKVLRPGGTLLLTVAGICQISQFDNKQWGDYWRFTPLSLFKLAAEVFGKEAVFVSQYGNSAAAILFLKGYSTEDTSSELLDKQDEDYPVVITLVAVKK